jgi:hypothetical protein
MIRPLLLVGAPRSLTTIIGQAAAAMLGFTYVGEKFNCDHAHKGGMRIAKQCTTAAGYKQISAWLLQRSTANSVVKDVEQPRLIARFLAEHPTAVNAFYLHRDAAEVRACLKRKGWVAPDPTLYEALYAGLPRLEYAAAIEDWRPLLELLKQLGYAPRAHDYLTPEFVAYRRQVRARFP